MMKRLFFVAMVLVVLVGTACEKIDKLLTFYIEEEETIEINSQFPVGVVTPLSPIAIPTNSEETFKNNNTRAELVKDVSLNKLTLSISNPQDENFDFLKKIEIYISSEGEEEVMIAFLEEVPKGKSSIQLVSTNAKLDKYIKSDRYTIRTMAELAKAITRDVSINANMWFKVTADPL
ncbi:hypothetical protein [Pontibacter harenae]|uniref:hypothetical protein n=1 Tax=Pontibacter harenae TaxID=2894083 RepID=UPI001E2DBFBD|nr:hypothetical protein [Pontibacter harenae]MCC9166396.1 hypothetical protein [Pontibacter harenae]